MAAVTTLFNKKITIDNAEFVSWKNRITALQTVLKSMKNANKKVHDSFISMSSEMSKFSSVFENSYPEDDDFRKLLKKTKEAGTIVSERTKADVPQTQFMEKYQAELDKIEADYIPCQKLFDNMHSTAKAKEKLASAKHIDETKLATATTSAETAKKAFETSLSDLIARMKQADAKKEEVFKILLAVNTTMIKLHSDLIRDDIQHALNFSTSGKKELLTFDFKNYSTDNKLTTPVPNIAEKAPKLKLQADSSWVKV
mmetsp:Transcript_3796/g.6642  ORF Transcript_3796/g.6642 Transcript_3796/m.6642 type:complete len:256 (-) Transcript_3796:858-1625(-)|eukprot:CAMPEP_0182451276 /NCGR_PEP_ID=MMETSP1172-20130603/43630_1 /TAXON_ID=708627 /ORGANISM="Timspurckia oligopyrenoides, Strain CCMP3278" /LENGTH=255 /DNA_ID=CAMNT_0024649035 /DNA_START=62 /DNA_END=829 /DNA_ORIENTATION=+